jgi:hypothetical protein
VEVIDDRQTGETILDETLRMMKAQQDVEKIAVNSWIDLLSGQSSYSYMLSISPCVACRDTGVKDMLFIRSCSLGLLP